MHASENQRRYNEGRRIVGLFGGLFSGALALLFLLAAPLFGVSFLPTAALPYGGILNLLSAVIWLPCVLVVNFPSRALLNFTFLAHVVALLVDIVAFVILLVVAYASLVTAAAAALQFGFVILPLVLQLVLKTYVTAALLRLTQLY